MAFRGPESEWAKCTDVDSSARGIQTWQRIVSLEPSGECEIVTVDLTRSFAIFEPGEYVFQFCGLWKWDMGDGSIPDEAPPGSLVTAVPESAPLKIGIKNGTLGVRDILLQRLFTILPQGWILYDGRGDTGVHIVFHRNKLDASDRRAAFSLFCGPGPGAGARRLGESPWGEIRIGPISVSRMDARDSEDERLEMSLSQTVLPGLEEHIRKALEIR